MTISLILSQLHFYTRIFFDIFGLNLEGLILLDAYRKLVTERVAQSIPPKALNAEQVAGLVELLKAPPAGEEHTLLELLAERVPLGVDEAAYVKACFLTAIIENEAYSPLISKDAAIQLLGKMHGGYNIVTLVAALDNDDLAELAAEELKHTLLMFDTFHDIEEKSKAGNAYATDVIASWADAEWFTARADMPVKITATVFKVTGETNTDDLSPAPDAWSRPDIPLHARAALKMPRDGLTPEKQGEVGSLAQIDAIKTKGHQVAFLVM
ncbi:MAG: aconitate hydratase 2/2-methylisocitrate dehydratase [Psychrobacter glaciei]